MRLPRSWDDADLNQDEPFATEFYARTENLRHPSSRRSIQAEAKWFDELGEEVVRADALGACQAWLDIVFAVSPAEKELLRKQHFFAANPRECRLFVEFFWRLYSTGARKARKVITDARQERGFRLDMDERPTRAAAPGGSGGDREADGARAEKRPCKARGRGKGKGKKKQVRRLDPEALEDTACAVGGGNAAPDAPAPLSPHDVTHAIDPVLALPASPSEDEKDEDIRVDTDTGAVSAPPDLSEVPSAAQRKRRASRASLPRMDESEQEGGPPDAVPLPTADVALTAPSSKQRNQKGKRRKTAASCDAEVNQDIVARRTRSKKGANAGREAAGSISAPTQLAAEPGNQKRLTRARAKEISCSDGRGLASTVGSGTTSATAAEPQASVQSKKKRQYIRHRAGRNENTAAKIPTVSATAPTGAPTPVETAPAGRKKRQRTSRTRTSGPAPSAPPTPTSDSAADEPASTGEVHIEGAAKRQKTALSETPVFTVALPTLESSASDNAVANEVPAGRTRDLQEKQGTEPVQEHAATSVVDLAGEQGGTLTQGEHALGEGVKAPRIDMGEKELPRVGQDHDAPSTADPTDAQGSASTLAQTVSTSKVVKKVKKPRIFTGEKALRKKRSDVGVKRGPRGPKRARTETGPFTGFEQNVQHTFIEDMPAAVGNAMHAIPGSNLIGYVQHTFVDETPASMGEAMPMIPGNSSHVDELPASGPGQTAASLSLNPRSRKRERPILPKGDLPVQDAPTSSNGPPAHSRSKKKLPRRRPPVVPTRLIGYGSLGMTSLQVIDAALSNIGAGGLEYHNHVPAPVANWDQDELDLIGYPDDDEEHGREQAEQESLNVVGPLSVQPQQVVKAKKPSLPGRPLIWARSRQEVCETLDCFRSYQGGVYFNNDVAKGYLLSAFAASRDMFEVGGRLIVSHGGGKAQALHAKSGQLEMRTAANQLAGDKSVRALLNNHKAGRPIVLLADDRYALFPFDLEEHGFTYVVLGMYRIVHAWAEYQLSESDAGRVIRYKFAFEWCVEQGTPWWFQTAVDPSLPSGDGDQTVAAEDEATTMPPPTSSDSDPPSGPAPEPRTQQHCIACHASSPKVYEQGWMCLQPSCSSFGLSETGADLFAGQLTYNPDFLILQHQSAKRNPAYDVHAPELPPTGDDVTTHRFSRGMHCKNCGRLSCRSKWEGWQCPSCQAFIKVDGKLRCHKDFWTQDSKVKKWLHSHVKPGSGIAVGPTDMPLRNISLPKTHQTFTLPNGRGKIHHIVADVLSNQEANRIFQEYQEQARDGRLEFRRWPLRIHKCRGELLTNYFSQNTGAPYQYVGGTDRTVPLESGPSAVIGALNLITNRVKEILGLDVPFNEVLSAAYMQKQKMAFHSDAERGLGGVVAGLSLGSMAQMEFRLHSQHAKTGDGRMNRGTVLTITLRHGDILVMDGYDVQKYYEHTVTPMNFRIAATARFISPENWRT